METAFDASPDDFRAAISDADSKTASDAAVRLLTMAPSGGGLIGLIQDMRAASGLPALSVQEDAQDTRLALRTLVKNGKAPDRDGMVLAGMPAAYASMVEYMSTFCPRELSVLMSDAEDAALQAMIARICDDTGLDKSAVSMLAKDLRPEQGPKTPEPIDPGLSFKKGRGREAIVRGYSGSSEEVRIPESVEIGGTKCAVTGIGSGAFNGNPRLRRIVIPDTVREIGRYAFFRCGALESVGLPDGLRSIGEGAFCKCCRLSAPSFPRTLESIGPQAFLGCGFDRVAVPKEASLGAHAFPDGALVARIRSDVAPSDLQRLLGAARGYPSRRRVLEIVHHVLYHRDLLAVGGLAHHQKLDLAPVVESPEGVHGLVDALGRRSRRLRRPCGRTARLHVFRNLRGNLGERLPAGPPPAFLSDVPAGFGYLFQII